MKKAAAVSLFTVGFLVFFTSRALAWHGHPGFHGGGGFHHFRGRVIVGVGPWWGPPAFWGPDYFWWGPGWGYAYGGPYPYPYPYWAPYPSPPYADQSEMYVSREGAGAPAAEGAPTSYWYYCASANDYYPNVKTCREKWIKVPSTPDSRTEEDRR